MLIIPAFQRMRLEDAMGFRRVRAAEQDPVSKIQWEENTYQIFSKGAQVSHWHLEVVTTIPTFYRPANCSMLAPGQGLRVVGICLGP